MWVRLAVLLVSFVTPLPGAGVFGQCQYEVTAVHGPNCGVLGPASVHFLGINEHGQACGRRSICGEVGQWLPIVWTEELGLVTLPLPEGATQGEANDINNVLGSDEIGQVACTLRGGTLGGDRAFLFDDGEWTMLPPENGSHSGAFAINDTGQVAGYRDVNGVRHAFVWQDGFYDQIASQIGGSAIARDMNAVGDTAGGFGALTTDGMGFLKAGDIITLIPPVKGGSSSEGRGLNCHNVVTGQSFIPVKSGSVPRRSWRYQNGTLIDLGGFADTHRNISEDINDAGQIVGSSFAAAGGSGETSYLWQDGELIRLDDLFQMPPGVGGLTAVKAINNRGQIVGYTGGAAEGIILTPIAPLGDVDLDCEVDGWDLALVLGNWGPCSDAGSCISDIVTSATFQPPPDGVVDGADLAVVLGNWSE